MAIVSVPLILINLNDDGFHLIVEISAFGNKCWAVVDTGASRSVFDKTFIEQHVDDVAYAEDNLATTLFTTSSIIEGIIPKLKIGKLTLKQYSAVALDLDTVNEAYIKLGHPKITAILGSDIFYRHEAKIDYKKLKIYFSKKPVNTSE